MAHSGAGRTSPTEGKYPVEVFDRGPGSLRIDVGYLNRDHISSTGRSMWKKEGTERQGAPPITIVVEQWICFVLGFICTAFGTWGFCIKSRRAFFLHGTTGIAICADIACNSNCVHRIRRNAHTPGMGAPLTAFSFQQATDNRDSLVSDHRATEDAI